MAVPERHILVCVGDDCRKRGGKRLCKVMKRALEEQGLKRKVKILEIDCLDQCSAGPMVLVYPDAVWYSGMDVENAETVVEEHLAQGQPLKQKLYRKAHDSSE
jgi:(2Fe-2S) ferredoxin